jgi:glycosyltransferase involved in cell wall biosynthesis
MIFAFTSSSEGFPNVVGEAMSAGLPIIAYDCVAGPSDMIEDEKNGYLVELFDDETFKKKLKNLMQNDTLRKKMGIESRGLIQKYSADRVSEQFYTFITESI